MNRITPCLLAAALLLVSWKCGDQPDVREDGAEPCPPVYQIFGAGDPRAAFNLVFLPDGFSTEEELESYRCAVRTLVDGMMASDLYKDLACHINVYRIDLASKPGQGGVQRAEGCIEEADPNCTPLPAPQYPDGICLDKDLDGTDVVTPGRIGCAKQDLDVRLCWDKKRCDVIWLGAEGQRYAKCLAGCAPAADAVIIVANSGNDGGGGLGQNDPPLAVITLSGMDYPAMAANLLAHETAHALFGLLDEYEDWYGGQSYVEGLNVASGEEVARKTFLWASECGTCPTWCNETREGCPKGLCGNGQPCCAQGPTGTQMHYPGLIEGAFYHRCGYYRAQDSCRMRELTSNFCAACRLAVKDLEQQMDFGSCVSPDQTAPAD